MADWVLIPCTGRRTHELVKCLAALAHDKANVCIVTTEPDPVNKADIVSQADHLVHLDNEFNYAKWLNAGIKHIAAVDIGARYVFITGSDTYCNEHTVNTLVAGAQANNLLMCGPDHWNRGTHVFDPAVRRNLNYRVPPEYFLLDLRLNLRLDEQFRWWYSEDDLEMQVRKLGSVGIIGNVYVGQKAGHEMSEQLAQWVQEDRGKFVNKWGHEPW